MDFKPIIQEPLKLMDARIFADEPMQLRRQMLERPLADRFSYNAQQDVFFVDFVGLSIRTVEDITRLKMAAEAVLVPIGHKVNAVVNYDRMSIVPELMDVYVDAIKDIVATYYNDVTRYSANSFLRMKLGEASDSAGAS
jgi:propionate CoA-transferase